MTFFIIFSINFLENLNLIFFLQNLEFLTLKLGGFRVLSAVANLAFKYECFFCDGTFLGFEVHSPVVGY